MAFNLTTEIVLGGITLVTAMLVSISKIKEARAKKKDPAWKPNPQRCEEERDRVTALEGQNRTWGVRFDGIDTGIADLKRGQQTILDLHLKN